MNEKIDLLLSRLDRVSKRRGGGGDGHRWLARCPAHDDKTPSLAIKLTNDEKILVHCFSGCSVETIVSAVGLSISDLMPPRSDYYNSGRQRVCVPRFNRNDLFEKLVFEATILHVAIGQLLAGTALSDNDLSRVHAAMYTIDELAQEVRL